MISKFELDTQFARFGDHTFTRMVAEGWSIGKVPNGGFVTGMAVRAMQQDLDPAIRPIAINTHFLRPTRPGEEIVCERNPIKQGRTLTTISATLTQAGKVCAVISADFAPLHEGAASAEGFSPVPPEMPPPDDCIERSAEEQGVDLPLLANLDIRLHPDCSAAGRIGKPTVCGWIRFRDETEINPAAIPLFLDAFPPALSGLRRNIGWVPTIQMSVNIIRDPGKEWLLGLFETRTLLGDRFIEDGSLWTQQGQLVAHSRQIGMCIAN